MGPEILSCKRLQIFEKLSAHLCVANQEYIRIYQYFYYRNKKYELERDLKKVYVIPNKIVISILED